MTEMEILSECIDILKSGTALNTSRTRLREIGEIVNEAGGFFAMQRVAEVIRQVYPYGEGGETGWHPGELDHAWDGIGKWMA